MKQTKTEQFILAYIYRGINKVIKEGEVWLCQKEKTKVKLLPQYKNGLLQVRRKEAYKNVPILKQTK